MQPQPAPRSSFGGISAWIGALSSPAKAFLVILAVVFLILCILSPANVIALPFCLAPPIIILKVVYDRHLRAHCDPGMDDIMLRVAFSSFLPVMLLTLLVETVLTLIGAAIFLINEINQVSANVGKGQPPDEAIANVRLGPGAFFLVLYVSFIVAALVEELAKVAVARRSLCVCTQACTCSCCVASDCTAAGAAYQPCAPIVPYDPVAVARRRAYNTIAVFLAASLGFSFGENLMYVCLDASTGSFAGDVVTRIVIAILRGGLSMPLHLTCAAFTALRFAFRDVQEAHNAALNAISTASVAPPGFGEPPITGVPVSSVYTIAELPQAAVVVPAPVVRQPPHPVAVWPWWRIMWPAVLIHGTFDAQAMLLQGGALIAGSQGTAIALLAFTFIISIGIVAICIRALKQQFVGIFDMLARGEVPSGITLGVTWKWNGRPDAASTPAPHVEGAAPSGASGHGDQIRLLP